MEQKDVSLASRDVCRSLSMEARGGRHSPTLFDRFQICATVLGSVSCRLPLRAEWPTFKKLGLRADRSVYHCLCWNCGKTSDILIRDGQCLFPPGHGRLTLAFLVQISGTKAQHKAFRLITMIRGTLISQIFDHTLKLSTSSLNESKAVTLMSSDIERIGTGLRNVHEIWACIIEIALAMWLLQGQLGISIIATGLVTLCVCLPLSSPGEK